MEAVLPNVDVSLEDLLEAEKRLQKEISEKQREIAKKQKEIALAKSGFAIRGNPIVDVQYFELLTNPSNILFVNWFVKVKLAYEKSLPKYIHECTDKNIPQTTYIFVECKNSCSIGSGVRTAVTIHEDSIPYLMDEFREWSWNLL